MKIKLYKVFAGIITLLIILELKIMNFGNYETPFRYTIAVTAVLLSCICFTSRNIWRKIRVYCKFFNYWIIVFGIFLFIQALIGFLVGHYRVVSVFSYLYIYIWLLLFYPIIYIIVSSGGIGKLLKVICTCTVCALLLKTFVWWMYNFRGKDIMHYVLYEFGSVWLRNGYQRIPSTCFSGMLFAAMIYYFINSNKKIMKLVCILIMFLNVWYADVVFASRSQIISFCFMITAVIIFNRSISIKKVMIYIGAVGAGLAFISTTYFKELVESLNVATYSIGTRMSALQYYFSLLKEHWLLGIEFISNEATFVHGSRGNYFLSDIGIIAKLVEFGVLGLPIFLFPLIRSVFICYKAYILKYKELSFMVGLCSYTCVFSVLSNDVYNFRYLFALPFIIAYFEYVNYNLSHLR